MIHVFKKENQVLEFCKNNRTLTYSSSETPILFCTAVLELTAVGVKTLVARLCPQLWWHHSTAVDLIGVLHCTRCTQIHTMVLRCKPIWLREGLSILWTTVAQDDSFVTYLISISQSVVLEPATSADWYDGWTSIPIIIIIIVEKTSIALQIRVRCSNI